MRNFRSKGFLSLFNLALGVSLSFSCGHAERAVSRTANLEPPKSNDDGGYLAAYFKSGPKVSVDRVQALHYAYSRNGEQWYELNENQAVFRPKWQLRDPFLAKGPDGIWRLVYTIVNLDANGNNVQTPYLGYAESSDLINWRNEKQLDLMANFRPNASVYNTWAPEWTYDEGTGDYVIYWASTLNFQPGAAHNNKHYMASTKDWNSFSPARTFFDPGVSAIDASIIKENGKYYLFYKDEKTDPMRIRQTWSSSLTDAAQYQDPGHTSSDYVSPGNSEGPQIFRLWGQSRWFMIYDYWALGKLGIKSTMDINDPSAWSAELGTSRFPKQFRHPGIAVTSEEEIHRLVDRFSLVAHLPFEGDARDTAAPGRAYGIEGSPSFFDRSFIRFNGQTDAIRLDGSSGDFLRKDFSLRSVSLWFRAEDPAPLQILFEEGGSVNGLLLKVENGQVVLGLSSEGRRESLAAPLGDAKAWHHVAGVFREGELLLFLDGNLTGRKNAGFSSIPYHGNPSGIGKRFDQAALGGLGDGAYFKGDIADFRIYSLPLFPKDVRDIFENTYRR